jgi:hypothetical protein
MPTTTQFVPDLEKAPQSPPQGHTQPQLAYSQTPQRLPSFAPTPCRSYPSAAVCASARTSARRQDRVQFAGLTITLQWVAASKSLRNKAKDPPSDSSSRPRRVIRPSDLRRTTVTTWRWSSRNRRSGRGAPTSSPCFRRG